MGTLLTNKDLRGFLVVDPALRPAEVDAALSSYTETTPRPGQAVGAAGSTIHPQIVGAQPRALVTRVGTPGIVSASGVKLQYRASTDTANDVRGWMQPEVGPTRYTAAEYGTTAWVGRDAVTLPDQRILATWSYSVVHKVGRYDPMADTWTIDTVPISGVVLQFPALAVLPNGDVLMYGTISNVGRIYKSTDAGDNWSLVSEVAPGVASTARSRLVVFADGTLGLWLTTTTPTITQYASVDGGATWTTVSTPALTAGTAVPDVVQLAPHLGSGVLVIYTDGSNAIAKRLDNPFQLMSEAVSYTINFGVVPVQVLGSSDPGGRVCCWALEAAGSIVRGMCSNDVGKTWANSSPFGNYGPIRTSDAGSQPALSTAKAISACGMPWMLHSFAATPSTAGPSIVLAGFGGWSSIGAYPYNLSPRAWVPYDLPSDMGWTGTGAGTVTLGSGGAAWSSSATQRYYSLTFGTMGDLMVVAELSITSGSTADDRSAIRIDVTDGATMKSLCVRMSTTQIVAYNNGTAPSTLATVSAGMTTKMQVLAAANFDGQCIVAFRRPYETKWTVVYEGAGLTAAVGTVGTLQWGRITAATSQMEWRLVSVVHADATATAGAYRYLGSSASPYSLHMSGPSLRGGAVPLGPDQQTAGAEVACAINCTDGPGVYAETHTIDPAYDYPVEALDPIDTPTSRVTWRSSSTAEQIFGWDRTNDTTIGQSRSIGLLIARANFRQAILEGWTGAAWTTLGTWDARIGSGLSWTRTGDIVRINGGASISRYIQRGELVGGTVNLGGSLRRIVSHSEGHWSTVAGRHLELQVELTGGEPASGAADMDVWSPSGVLVVHGANGTLYDQYRVRLPALVGGVSNPRDSYFEAGLLIPGGVLVLGQQWSYGSNASLDPRVESTESAAGVLRVRQVGHPVESWTMSWTDGLDEWAMRNDPTGAGWLGDGSSATEALATYGDVAWLLRGLFHELGGGAVPVVALPAIPKAGGMLTDPTLFLAGFITTPISWELANGDEGEGEVYRVGSVTVRGMP